MTTFKRIILALLLALCCACGPRAEAVTADAVAIVANAAIGPLATAYEAEGMAAIRAADTVDELMVAVPTVKERWRPVWDALRSFAEVHDAWATALETGQERDNRDVQAAWCELRRVAEEFGVVLGDFPVMVCP